MCTHACESERVCRNHCLLLSLWTGSGEIIVAHIPANGDISKYKLPNVSTLKYLQCRHNKHNQNVVVLHIYLRYFSISLFFLIDEAIVLSCGVFCLRAFYFTIEWRMGALRGRGGLVLSTNFWTHPCNQNNNLLYIFIRLNSEIESWHISVVKASRTKK